ncbi:bilirubin utilization transcriptional regulator BilQ [Longibaculum muris]|uniref:bilirubin utilization transcriptional regulator BilQ n=1 Tax=Longibaculum muris TaxID=1796628 RepID=UPI00189EBB64|nr:bilirubin utilization transcriptional regulator BilQ [Longibaculum muris]
MFHSFAFYAVLMQRQFREYCQKELRDAGLSSGLLFFILYIGKHPGCNVKSLITALKLDSGHATLSLAKLEQNHFIQQNINPNDKRSRILYLTNKGQEIFQLSHDFFRNWDQSVLACLSYEEKENLFQTLDKIADYSNMLTHLK